MRVARRLRRPGILGNGRMGPGSGRGPWRRRFARRMGAGRGRQPYKLRLGTKRHTNSNGSERSEIRPKRHGSFDVVEKRLQFVEKSTGVKTVADAVVHLQCNGEERSFALSEELPEREDRERIGPTLLQIQVKAVESRPREHRHRETVRRQIGLVGGRQKRNISVRRI